MRRKILFIIMIVVLLHAVTATVYAHPGRTDGNGGHTDHSTGDYHYHHGYPAHYHYDMNGDGIPDCSYEFKNQTNNISGDGSTWIPNNNTTSQDAATKGRTANQYDRDGEDYIWSYIAISFVIVVILFSVYLSRNSQKDIYPTKMDNETKKEVWQGADFVCALLIVAAFAGLFTYLILLKAPIEIKVLPLGGMFASILMAICFGAVVLHSVYLLSYLVTLIICWFMKKDIGNPTSQYLLGFPLAYLFALSTIIIK